MEMNCLVTYIS